MDIQGNIPKETSEGLSIQQSEDARKFFASLLLTCKNVSLYPEGHSISVNSIKQFHETLVNHIRQHGDIRIEFERDRVICQGLEVHKGPSEEGTLPFTLFRDGIRWLEFTEGIELEETKEVLSLIHKYSILTMEPEGDIVTAFWEAHFEHVLYKADDLFSEQESDEIDNLSKSDLTQTTTETEAESPSEAEAADQWTPHGSPAIDTKSLVLLAIDPSFFVLTPQEQIELQEMISQEEKASTTEHLNMLLDMLLQCKEEKDFNIVLEVLSEEIDISFERGDFEAGLIILDGVRKILDSDKLRADWAKLSIESHYKNMSSAEKCLKPLEKSWSTLNAQQIETLKQIFQHLKPEAVDTLVHLLLIGQSSQLEQTAESTIITLARQNMRCLDSLMNDPDERIAEILVPVLSRLEGETSLRFLMKLAKHSSVSVRRMAIKAITNTRDNQQSAIFEFIDDPDLSVSNVILKYLGQSRSEVAENILLQYLQNRRFKDAQNEHIIESFQTLGKCGSFKSIPFLRKTLLHRKWMAGWSKSTYRKGAALALVALNIPEARQIIEEAGRSFYPGLRKIAREAGKDISSQNRGGR